MPELHLLGGELGWVQMKALITFHISRNCTPHASASISSYQNSGTQATSQRLQGRQCPGSKIKKKNKALFEKPQLVGYVGQTVEQILQ